MAKDEKKLLGGKMTERENFSSNAQDSSAVGEHLTSSHTDP